MERSEFVKWSRILKQVSVVIPTIGRIEYLDKAIESLLNQTIPFYEIVIFDNSIEQNIRELSKFSNDTKLIWKKSGKQMSPIDSWNNAINLTRGEYVTVFGDDDLAYRDFHAAILENLEKSDFVFINRDTMDEHDTITHYNNQSEIIYSSNDFRYLRMKGKLQTTIPGAIFKKSFFDKIQGYEASGLPNFLYSDDLFYFKLAALVKEVSFSGKSSWKYRIHSNQIGNLKKANLFPNSINIYIEKLESSLKHLNVQSDEYYPKELNKIAYINKLILDRFFIVIFKFLKGNKIKLALQNLIDLIENKFLSSSDKFKLFSKIIFTILETFIDKRHLPKNTKLNIKFLYKIYHKNIKNIGKNKYLLLEENKFQIIEKTLPNLNYDFSIKFNKLNTFIQQLKEKNSSFAIYGFGLIGKSIIDSLENKTSVIVDQNKELKKYKNIDIVKPNHLNKYQYDYIIISVLGREIEIEKFLVEELKVSKDKLICINLI